jgi:hypothetical protein
VPDSINYQDCSKYYLYQCVKQYIYIYYIVCALLYVFIILLYFILHYISVYIVYAYMGRERERKEIEREKERQRDSWFLQENLREDLKHNVNLIKVFRPSGPNNSIQFNIMHIKTNE